MSKVLEEMKTRRSIRKFKPDMIPQDILDRIIEAGTFTFFQYFEAIFTFLWNFS